MRILITNDDGITAPGLAIAEAIAAELAGPEGDIWVVAPEGERSGVSHAISYTAPVRITRFGPRRHAIDGYPADCVLVGMHAILGELRPDLVLSGVNRGHNVAEDVVYSGTVGGAMEAALAGVRGIALSQYYGTKDHAPADMWEPARALGAATVRKVLEMPWPRGVFYNVNFPAHRLDLVRGTRVCAQGLRAEGTFDTVEQQAPNGRTYYWLRHMLRNFSAQPETDAALCASGWVTVTPLRPDLTAHDLLAEAAARLG